MLAGADDLSRAADRGGHHLVVDDDDTHVLPLDLIVVAPDAAEGVFIEANERPGLANHEPQPTAERFVDLLFPATRALPWGWRPEPPAEVAGGG